MKKISGLALALSLGSALPTLTGCNFTQQLDRDAGACIIIPKDAGGSCTVTLNPRKETLP